MRYVSLAAAMSIALALFTPGTASAQAPPALSIANYQYQSEVRVTRNLWYVTYTADVVNPGGTALSGVTATATSSTAGMTIVPGQGTLEFPTVPAHGQVTSVNTFTVLLDRTTTASVTSLSWSFLNPVANAGLNQTVTVGNTVTLNGSGSTNPFANGPLTYSWTLQTLPSGSHASLSNPAAVMPTFVADSAGSYVAQLTVNNGVASSSATVTISTVSTPPVANAGTNQIVSVGATVHLSGTGSYDLNGNTLTYAWSFVNTPATSLASLSDPTAVSPTFVADAAGSYILQLIVTDSHASSVPSTVTINTGRIPPTANAGTSQSVTAGSGVQLTGAGSTDINGNPLTYQWSFLSVPSGSTATLSSNTAVTPTFTPDKAGTYVAQLIVNDGVMNSLPATVTITTNAVLAPTAFAGQSQTISHGATVTLSGSGTDPQGLPLSMSWSLITVPSGSVAALSSIFDVANPTFVADQPGTYVAQLIVSNGRVSSAPSTVTITTTFNPPIANAGPNQQVSPGSTVTLDGTQSKDPNREPMTPSWTLLARPAGSSAVLVGASTFTPSFVADVQGVYVAQLIVTDAFASSTPATVTVAAGVNGLSLSPNPLNLFNATGTLTVAAAPNPNGVTVNLSGFNPAVISAPSSVTLPAGITTGSVTVTPVGPGNTSITASATGFPSTSATVNVTTPAITLNLSSSTVGLNASVTGTITLAAPAPAAGTVVSLAANPVGSANFNPSSVTIPGGQSTGTVTITGEALGTTTITASATSYANGTANLTVQSLGTITLPANVTVPVGQSAALSVSLQAAAPAGGVTVTLASSNTGVLTVSPSVFIAQGQTTPSTAAQITGVSIGSVNVTASATSFTGATVSVGSVATLSFSTQAVSVSAGGVQSTSLLLSAPAPTGGLSVTLSSSNTAAATVPTSASFSAGATSIPVQITGVAAGSAVITATAPNTVQGTTNVTVTGPPVITTTSLANGIAGVAYSTPVAGSGGVTPYSWSATGLPTGLAIDPVQGTISGNTSAAGTSSVTVTLTDSTTGTHLTASKTFSLTIAPTLSITTTSLASGLIGTAYSAPVVAIGGTTPYSWSATSLPAGLTIDPVQGTISGTPTAPGTFSVSIRVADSTTPTSLRANAVLSLNISSGLVISTSSLPTAIVGSTYSQTITAIGGTTPYTWSATGLPTGLTIDPNLGTISGTPSAAGTSSVVVTVTDSATPTHASASKTLSLTIIPFISISTTSLPTGAVGSAYLVQIAVQGGLAPYVWSTTALPAGLTFDTVNGIISGNPTANGITNVTITVTDSTNPMHLTASKTFSLTIGALSITTTGLANGTLGVAYSAPVAASGGTTPYAWSATGLPGGLTIDPIAGTISGTPTTAGTSSVIVTVTDATSPTHLSVSKSFSLTIGSSVSITTTSLPNALIGSSYTGQLAASGGTPSYTWSATSLPAGLTLNSSTGAISGTASGPSGKSNVTFTVTDSATPVHTINAIISINVIQPLSITTTSLPGGAANQAYTTTLAATGGTLSYTWSATGLPTGLTINASTGVISGNPASNGTSSVVVTVTDATTPTALTASKTLSLTIGATLSITSTTSLPTGIVGVAYSTQVIASGGTTPYAWSVNSLPAGLTLDPVQGIISGSPATAGTSSIVITVTDSSTPKLSAFTTLTLAINPSLSITTTTLPSGIVGLVYSAPVIATGGTTPYAWSATGLPAGLTIDPNLGTISGNPTGAGTSSVTIRVLDATTPKNLSASQTITVTINPGLSITTASLPNGVVNGSYTTTVVASGGTTPYAWSATGLPQGLTIDPVQGIISGTPTTAVSASVTVFVSDATNPTHLTSSKPFTITINPALSVSTSTLPAGIATSAYSATMNAAGGTAPFTWSATGLPNGLTMSAAGAISGIPSAAGTSSVIFSVTDNTSPTHQTATATISLTINPGPSVSTTSLPNGIGGGAYSATMAATGGTSPYTWAVTGLPTGLTMNSGGVISGTPTAPGTASLSFTVTDSTTPTHLTATKSISLTVNPGLSISTTSLPNAGIGQGYSATVTATGGSTPYAWSATGLPNGLTINSSTGVISGTPTTAGTSSVNVTVTDATTPSHLTASATLSLTVQSVDIIVPATLTVAPGNSTAFNITLAQPSPSGTFVTLTSSDTTIATIPSQIFFSAGQTTPTRTPQITGVAQGSVTITAAASGLNPSTSAITVSYGLTLSPTQLTLVGGGNQSSINLLLASPALSTITFTLSSNNTAVATVPSTINILQGSSSNGFMVTSVGAGNAIIHVSAPGIPDTTANVQVLPPGAITLSGAATLGQGSSSPVTITLSTAAPSGGVTVNLTSSDNTKLTVSPASVTIASGATQPTVAPQMTGVGAGSANISATALGYALTAPLAVQVMNVSVANTSLTSGFAGTAYSAQMNATGGTAPYSWSATGLPSGLTISTTGLISGTPATAGTANVAFTVTDNTSPTHLTGNATLTLNINAALSITTSSVATGVVGAAYSSPMAATGGTTPYAWSATGLPTGLTIDPAAGTISGSPSAAGTSSVVVTVTDSTNPKFTNSKTFTLTVSTGVGITTASLPNGVAGSPYPSTVVTASGGTTPYAWSATGLPTGLTIDPVAGTIAGTPFSAGTASIVVTVTDSSNPAHLSSQKTFSITIAGALSISTASLNGGTAGVAYSSPMAASGGTTPYTWSATGLPTGLTIDPAAGTISGMPAASGTSNVNVTVTDSTSPTHATATKGFTLVINPGLSITTTSLASGIATLAYSSPMAATGGVTPYTWSATGLPTGLAIDPAAGTISGITTASGTFSAIVSVTDSTSPAHLSTSVTLPLTIAPALTITTTSLANGFVNTAYSFTMAAAGGTTPYRWTASALPNGLTMNSAGVISGTPTTAGTVSVSFSISDSTPGSRMSASTTLTLTVFNGLGISTTSLPNGFTGTGYSATMAAIGGLTPYTWSVTGLPAGLTMNAGGVISGSPTSAGPSNPLFTVTDSTTPTHNSVSVNIPITIGVPLSITNTTSLASGIAGQSYSAQLSASGGTPGYTWSVTGLPAGLTMNAAGAITGSPASAGTSNPSFTVTDSTSPTHQTATVNLSITINPTVSITTTSPLPQGFTLAQYSVTMAATGGTPNYTWSATGLPSGLTISAGGVITGTPSASGTTTAQITVTDSTTPTHISLTVPFTITISQGIGITTSSLPIGFVNATYAATMGVGGGTAPYTWTVTGLLAGLTMTTGGVISGSPTSAGTSNAMFTVTDSTLPTHLSTNATIAITVNPALAITTTSLASGVAGGVYSAQLAATGGTPTYTWSVTGLPTGLTMNAAGAISGSPSTAGTSNPMFTVTDSTTPTHFSVSASIAIVVGPGLSITTTALPGGTFQVAYTGQMAATGGTPNYTWTVTNLPAGLTMNTAGAISGSPTSTGTMNVQFTVTDSTTPSHLTVSTTIAIAINAGVSITTTQLPLGFANSTYSATMGATGGTPSYTWTVTGLPAGLTMTTGGVISGSPSAAGTSTVTFTVTDSTTPAHTTASVGLTLTVNAALAISTTSLNAGFVNSQYSATMAATGGLAPYTWTVTNLPAGLTMNSAGAISGSPSATGTTTANFTVTDSATHTKTAGISITINPGVSITTSTLPNGVAGNPYPSTTMAATGGTSPYTWTVTNLPAGLTMNSAGAISGSPSAAGTANVSFTATDTTSPTHLTATANITITINPALSITTSSLTNGIVQVAYSAPVAATGGTTPYTWSATGLPSGLTIDPAAGTISGSPTTVGTSSVVITVTDATSPTHITKSTAPLTLVIGPTLSITTTSLANGLAGEIYSAPMAATGGTTPYSWSATGLPTGLTIDPAAGTISGNPTTAGTSNVTITVTDATSPHLSVQTTLALTINPGVSITTTALNNGVGGQAYSSPMAATGGTPTYTWSATSLPAGLTISATTGTISGTPVNTGTTNITANVVITVTDSSSPTHLSVPKTLPLTILPQLSITTASPLVAGSVGVAYSQPMAAVGGTAPYTWSATNLPTGLTISASTGQITGTPGLPGTTTVTVTATDTTSPTNISVSKPFSLTIAPAPLVISTTSLPNGAAGTNYSQQLTANGGTQPFTWSATGLPRGFSISTNGVISGTPSTASTSSVVVTVTDAGTPPQNVSTTLSLAITPAPLSIFTTTIMPGANSEPLNTPYSAPLQAQGGVTPYSWSATGLPTGITINSSTGTISGTPTINGTFTVGITVNDSESTPQIVSGQFTLVTGNGINSLIALGNVTVGQNLEVPMTITFSPVPAVATSVTLTSSDATNVLLGAQGAAGSGTLTFTVQAGTTTVSTNVQALGNTGTFTITVAAAGYSQTAGTGSVTLANSGFVIGSPGIGANFSTFEGVTSANSLTVYAARLDGTGQFVESEPVAGGMTVSVPVTSSVPSIGTVSPTTLSFTGGVASLPLTFVASKTNSGTTGIILTTPAGFTTPLIGGSISAAVNASGMVAPTQAIGQNLQALVNVALTGPATSQMTITVTTSDITKLAFSTTPTGTLVGTLSLVVPVNQSGTPQFYMQALGAPGTVPYTINSTTLGTVSASATITPAALYLTTPGGNNKNFSMSSSTSSANIVVNTAETDPSGQLIPQLVASGQSITATVTSSNTAVGIISSSPVIIGAGSGSATTLFQPRGTLGSSTITASATVAGSVSITATVIQSGMSCTDQLTIGQFLQEAGECILGSAAPTGGVDLVLTSNNPSLLILSTDPTKAGSGTITVHVPAGQQVAAFAIYALGGINTSASYTATASGYTGSGGTMTFAPSGIAILGPSNVSLSGGPQSVGIFTLQLSTDGNNTFVMQENLMGGASLPVTLQNSNPGAGILANFSVQGTASGTFPPAAGGEVMTFTTAAGTQTVTLSVSDKTAALAVADLNNQLASLGIFATLNTAGTGISFGSSSTFTVSKAAGSNAGVFAGGAGSFTSTISVISPNTNEGQVLFAPTAAGTTTITVVQPSGYAPPAGFTTQTITVQ